MFFVCFGLVVVLCVLFAWLLLFLVCGFGFSLRGPLTGLCTGPLPGFCGYRPTSRQPCMIIAIHLFAAIERV